MISYTQREKIESVLKNGENEKKKIFIHGTGQAAVSWDQTVACMKQNQEILCPDLSSVLAGKEAPGRLAELLDKFYGSNNS